MEYKFYITTPIYYASGDPHIGHAFGVLYADVIARRSRALGKDVFFSAGMDEHGSKIAEKAKLENKSPREFVDGISEKYIKVWSVLNIKYDGFIRTTSETHKKTVLVFIKKLWESGDIYEGDYEGLYCIGCENFITEKDLIDGVCPNHKQPPQKIKEKNYFFNLKKYLPKIKEKIESGELKIIPESGKNEILKIIDSKIPDFSITREKNKVEWGIPFPYDENQNIYVWVEALMNYASILDFPDGEKFKKFWPPDVHIIGADINKFHSIFWPGLLMSVGLDLPKSIFSHGLFTINGQKISKTLGNVIDPIKMAEEFGTDAARYLLLSQFSAYEHGDIKESDFVVKYNADLANGLGNLFERVCAMIKNYDIKTSGEKLDGDIEKETEDSENKFKRYMENYQLFDALKTILLFAKKLDKYVDDKKPWVLAKNKDAELEIALNSLLFGIERIVEWIEPFMPEKAEQTKNHIEKLKSGNLNKDEKLNLFPRK